MSISYSVKAGPENGQTVQPCTKARPKRRITMWDLLKWAYITQQVEHCGSERRGGDGGFASQGELGMSVQSSGGGFNVPEDALEVEAKLWRVLAGRQRTLVIWSARTGDRPPAEPRLTPLKVVPMGYSRYGNPWVETNRRGKPYLCPVMIRGHRPEDVPRLRAEARAAYLLWFTGLVKLSDADWRLSRFEVAGIGVPAAPWDGGA